MNTLNNIENPMPPLWLMYPHISRYSIGWRMEKIMPITLVSGIQA